MSAFRSSNRQDRSGGFAIPAAVFVIVIVSMLALTGLYVAQNNAWANLGIRRSWKAFYAADAGATHVLARWNRSTYAPLQPGDSVDTGWQPLADGSQYRTTVLRVDDGQPPNPMIYRLRTVGRPGAGVTAQRSLVTMVEARRMSGVCCDGAVKARGRMRIQGTGNVVKVDGRDTQPSGWSAHCSGIGPDLPGIIIEDEDDLRLNGRPRLRGTPPILEDGSISDQDFAFYDDLADMADKRLVGDQSLSRVAPVAGGGACQTAVMSNWGDPLNPGGACWDYLPIIHVEGDLRLSGNGYGQGILLVDGDLRTSGTFDFYGVIVVMGEADLGGTPRVHGGLLVGNGLRGNGQSHLRGNEGIHYSSCAADRALSRATIARKLSGRHWFEVLE